MRRVEALSNSKRIPSTDEYRSYDGGKLLRSCRSRLMTHGGVRVVTVISPGSSNRVGASITEMLTLRGTH